MRKLKNIQAQKIFQKKIIKKAIKSTKINKIFIKVNLQKLFKSLKMLFNKKVIK
jgi:hypothetical protein